MRTREIEVWVDPEELKHFKPGEDIYYQFNSGHHDEYMTRAKLIFDLPERKVTISESEFDEAWRAVGNSDGLAFNHIKQKLFGDEE